MIDQNHAEALQSRLGADWPHLRAARKAATQKLDSLREALAPFEVPDTSIVVFGSLARLEFTSESDIDWTLLLDGASVPEHLDTAIAIANKLAELENKKPGREGTFGSLAPSHDLIHYIGGEDDTNSNTTRRSLLLLESKPLLNSEAYDRVRGNLLKRYLQEDGGLWRDSNSFKVPHFLLNDFARYWRTMTVDFAYKQRSRANEGFALRNIKLRMSRKLIFIAGLLACFKCHLHLNGDEKEAQRIYRKDNLLEIVSSMRETFTHTPLDILALVLSDYESLYPSVRNLFAAYDAFIGILADKAKRDRLSELKPDEFERDPIYKEAREISHSFRKAIEEIFLHPTNEIGELTIRFGVF